jgi:hypothetical protein
MFPTKYFKAAEFGDEPMQLEIECVRTEDFEGRDGGKPSKKPVVYFKRQKSGLVVGPTAWDAIADATGEDDSANWPGHIVELHKGETMFRGEVVDSIKIRKPNGSRPAQKKTARKPDFDDGTGL